MSSQLNLSITLSTVGASAAAKAIGQIGASITQLQQQIASASTVQDRLRTRIESMRSSGAIVQRSYDRLTESIERARAAADGLAKAQERVARHTEAIGQLKADAYAVVGLAASMAVPIRSAVDFESAMADVRKVVDGTDAEIAALGDTIKRMGREIPLAHTELAALAAAGGQLGVKLRDLPDFVRTTAQMAVAFDMAAEEAGEAMAKVANAYGIPIREINRLGDAINQISNESPAKASEIVRALSRVGGVARSFGLSAEAAAALSGAFIAMGKPPEVAATSINAMLTKMMTADKQGKRFQAGLKAIGMSASKLKGAIGKDAQGALLGFLNTLNALPKGRRMSVLVDLFGLEYADDIAALAGSLDVYRAQIAAVQSSAGSMTKEFAARAATTANNWQLLKNTISGLSIEIGSALLPVLNRIIGAVRPAIEATASWARANQPLIETIGKVAGALLLLNAGSLAARFAFHGIGYLIASSIAGFAKLRAAIVSIGLTWQVLATTGLPALKAVGGAVLALGRAMVATPIGAILVAIAGAAYLIWRNWDVIAPKLAAVWQKVKGAFSAAWEWISSIPQRMTDIGSQIIDGLLKGINERWQALKEGVSRIASSIADTVRVALGIRSPSRVFAEIGEYLMGGLQLGIERAAGLPLSAMRVVAASLAAPVAAGAVLIDAPQIPPIDTIQVPPPQIPPIDTIQVPPPQIPPIDAIQIPPPQIPPIDAIQIPPPQATTPPQILPIDAIRIPPSQVVVQQATTPPQIPSPQVVIQQATTPPQIPPPQVVLQQTATPPQIPQLDTSRIQLRQMASPAINITVNLNGSATPETAHDIATSVRREVERALAEAARRDALARRAALIDGGVA